MEKNPGRLQQLFREYLDHTITKEGYQELLDLLGQEESPEMLGDEYRLLWESCRTNQTGITAAEWDKKINVLIRRSETEDRKAMIPTGRLRSFPRFFRYAAAVIILLGGIGIYAALFSKTKQHTAMAGAPSHFGNDIKPGKDNAVLTLADGSQIILDNAANGSLAQQGNIKVIKLNGLVTYKPNNGSNAAEETIYNTITTPRGSQYHLILADGSKVWLNAASSIRFPTAFNGKERNVTLSGEGYFEVAHDASRPFHVSVNGMNVEVLGTHFNINSYADEPVIRTTLLQGMVKVVKDGKIALLKPGQQANLDQHNNSLTVKPDADVDEAIAWKNGKFDFRGARIDAVMRQLARWYDVEVDYSKNLPDEDYVGLVARSENISAVLKTLEATKTIKFGINGRKITVVPYDQ